MEGTGINVWMQKLPKEARLESRKVWVQVEDEDGGSSRVWSDQDLTSQRRHRFLVEFPGLLSQLLLAAAKPNWPMPTADSWEFE